MTLGRKWIVTGLASAIGLALAGFGTPAGAQDVAKARLEKSPRHQEWVEIRSGERKIKTFVVFPEKPKPVPAVIVIHENRGLTDWARGAADQIAEAGYVALAPDLLSGTGPGGGGTDSFPSQSDATKGIYALPPDQVTADLDSVYAHAMRLPGCNHKVAVAGFCRGGGQAFRYATHQPKLAAAFVFYGPAPDADALARVAAPVYGFYAGNDARIDAGIPAADSTLKKFGKVYDFVTYAGAGHAFMRAGEEPTADEANRSARDKAWVRMKKLLAKL